MNNEFRPVDDPPEIGQDIVLRKPMMDDEETYWHDGYERYTRKFNTGWEWKPIKEELK